MADLSVSYVDLDDLPADPRNPKTHDVPTLIDSIRRFGFADPMVVDERTGRIISGHGRVEALRIMRDDGQDPPDGVRDDDGVWKVPTVTGWASENDDEAGAALVALNRLTETGAWDERALLDLLDQLSEIEHGMVGVGYGEDEMEQLRRLLAAYDADGVDPYAEWEGMPAFEQENRRSAFSVTIHFPTEADADRFFDEIDRTKRSSMWWPDDDGLQGTDASVEYVQADG